MFSINIHIVLQINPKWDNERQHVCVAALTFCFSHLVQIQSFSSGFWDGTKLACWMKGEMTWSFFPKLSIYLRATNTSQSFRITILPQVQISTSLRDTDEQAALVLLLILSIISQLYIQQITDISGTLDCFRFGVSSSVNGLVIGATVMEGFYVVFDRAHQRLGFALSNCAGEEADCHISLNNDPGLFSNSC